MIGYVSSAGADSDSSNVEITVIYADDFRIGYELAPKEIFTYNRISGSISKIVDAFEPEREIFYGKLSAVVDLLRLEETKSNMAMRVFWRDNFAFGPETVRSEYLEGVWFPSPVLTGGCQRPCLNVTGWFYDYAPSTLEISFLCDVLNMLFCKCKIRISTPFYCLYNSLFISCDALKLFHEILNDELFSVGLAPESTKILRTLVANEKNTGENVGKVIEILKNEKYEEVQYQGTRHNFAINIKRSCMSEITGLVLDGFEKKLNPAALFKELSGTVSSYISRFITLSELFVVSSNLDKASDIKYLTLYELMSAFAFSEKAMALKSMVRNGKARITHLNKTKIPCAVFPDGRCR